MKENKWSAGVSPTIKITLIAILAAFASSARLMAQEAYAVYTPSDKTLTFYYDSNKNGRTGIVYNLNQGPETPKWIREQKEIVKAKFDYTFAQARPTSTSLWFYECNKLTEIEGIMYLNTSEVTNMFAMFQECNALQTLDVSGFNTDRVTDMAHMFVYCSALKRLDVSRFNTSNVTKMDYMFDGCSSLTSLNVSKFNTSKVTTMEYMFFRCKQLQSINVSRFDTRNVQSMEFMFYECKNLTSLDLSSFNTSKVTSIEWMFKNCDKLETIYAGLGWVINEDATKNQMFYGCVRLVGGEGTAYADVYDTSIADDSHFAQVDGGEEDPGFFTVKSYGLTVSGREVTSMNYDNILGNSSAIYEPFTHTLTLNGGTFGKARQTAVFVADHFDENYSLNIHLNGQNILNSNPYYGITSYRSLWLEGDGSLQGDGINMVSGHLWINDCKLNVASIHATAEQDQNYWMNGSNAQVTLQSNIYGFSSFNLDVNAGLQILQPQMAYYDLYDRYVKDEFGNEAHGVVIGRPGGGTTAIGDRPNDQFPNRLNDQTTTPPNAQSRWFTIDGRQLNGAPTQRGVYVREGRKIVR